MIQIRNTAWPVSFLFMTLSLCPAVGEAQSKSAYSLADVTSAGRDLWGEEAMALPNGPSFEFYEDLLPPPRYVHADFRYYPLVLSAPGEKAKARLISNGSGVNLRGGSRSWKDAGTPVVFRVGPDEFRFGDLRNRVSLPQLAEGWLPIYEITYRHPYPQQAEGAVPIDQRPTKREAEVYRLEAFVGTAPELAEYAVVFVRFSLAAGSQGIVSVQVEPPIGSQFGDRSIEDAHGSSVVLVDSGWKWDRQACRATLKPGTAATIAIPTKPLPPGKFSFDDSSYEIHRDGTIRTWKEIVARAMQVDVNEPRINNAWRNLIVQNFMLLQGNRIHYSAGNQYDQLYESEGSDAALAMLNWGYEEEAKRMIVPLLDFTRKGLEHHQAGIKLNDVIRCWWQTRDQDWIRATRPKWEPELRRLIDHRDSTTGLLPKERYCGDISTPVNSLSVESKAWRALKDLQPVLRQIGDSRLADDVSKAEALAKSNLQSALADSLSRNTTPPFIPNALRANESVHDPITGTRIGSYWNLVIGYTIGSRIFPRGSAQEEWIPRYLEQHGGLCMGMIRSGGSAHGFWTGPERVNPLYGTRYVVDTLRRDEPDRALASFYGMLAQGFTRNTLIAGEGCTLDPVDDGGRFFYCPPNSAGNAHFLTMLRNLCVQEWDEDDDSECDSLRLFFATSRRWLNDGSVLRIDRAPTSFGTVSAAMESQLSKGQVNATITLPSGRAPPKSVFLRARVPDDWHVDAARIGDVDLHVGPDGTVDLSGRRETIEVEFRVSKR